MKDQKDLKGTKTERNLQEAFAGESMARNKYSYFASKARKDGYEQIAPTVWVHKSAEIAKTAFIGERVIIGAGT